MTKLDEGYRTYGVLVRPSDPRPPTVREIMRMPFWTHVWAIQQLVIWVYQHGGDLDELAGNAPEEYHAEIFKAWEEEARLRPRSL